MSTNINFESLIIVEGSTDVTTYRNLLKTYGVDEDIFNILSAGNCTNVCDLSLWNNIEINSKETLYKIVKREIQRTSFKRILLIIDSDFNNEKAFDKYKRNNNFDYVDKEPNFILYTDYILLDNLDATNEIPIYGITVPLNDTGCLETDLLNTYGYPTRAHKDYDELERIIKATSGKWNIHKDRMNREWYDINHDAKMDKFIYSALHHGFWTVWKAPSLPSEPDIIKHIKEVLSLS
jgi:5S rRNA maturation endonuclease (ribonuclease M5)